MSFDIENKVFLSDFLAALVSTSRVKLVSMSAINWALNGQSESEEMYVEIAYQRFIKFIVQCFSSAQKESADNQRDATLVLAFLSHYFDCQ